MSLLLLLQSPTGGPPPVSYPVVTFAGVERPIRRGSLDIYEPVNGRNSLTCDVVSTTAAYRPSVDDELIVMMNSERIFGGTINKTTERGAGDEGIVPLLIRVEATDFNALADRRYLATTLAAGTLKSMFTTAIGYLPGVTVDPAQVTGPSLSAMVCDYKQATEVLNDLASITGYVWEIDYNKVARMFNPGSVAAPFNVTTANRMAIGDIQVDQNPRTEYANRIILRYGSGQANVTESFTANGSAYSFPLGYKFFSDFQVVTNNSVPESLTVQGIGFDNAVQWLVFPSDNSLRRLTAGTPAAPAAGNVITITYTAQFPGTVIREDVPAQAPPIGLVERLVSYPDVFDTATATALADAELARRLSRLTTVRYVTRQTSVRPGMTQTITVPARNLNASYTVTDIRTNDDPDLVLRRAVTAVQGTALPDTFRDVYKRWNDGGSSTSSGGGVGGGGGGIAFTRNAYFLGGTGVESVRSSTPTWVNASDINVTLDTTARGGTTATVTGRLRAAAGSVTARLQNITDNVTAGTSSVVSSTVLTPVTFTATLTPGARVYKLQVLPSLPATSVQAVGVYVE